MSLANIDQSARRVLAAAGPYPFEAFEFVREGLGHTVRRVRPAPGSLEPTAPPATADATALRKPEALSLGEGTRPGTDPERHHVNGQQLCLGLRDFAIDRFGVMAPAVFAHWNIHRTDDFGRIVFAMIAAKLMSKTDDDSLDDFRSVYDFDEAFSHDALLRGIGVRSVPLPTIAQRS